MNGKNILLENLFQRVGFFVHVHRSIIEEVLQNINVIEEKNFYFFLREKRIEINDDMLSIELFQKYKSLGLKKGDITIAAFCDKIGADYLITENRHFLKSKKQGFQVLDLQEFLKKFGLI